jgi:hypothetical protein
VQYARMKKQPPVVVPFAGRDDDAQPGRRAGGLPASQFLVCLVQRSVSEAGGQAGRRHYGCFPAISSFTISAHVGGSIGVTRTTSQ